MYKRQAVGLAIAIVGGSVIEKLGLEDQVAEFVRGGGPSDEEMLSMTKRDRLVYARGETGSTFKKVFPYILVGVAAVSYTHLDVYKRQQQPREIKMEG